MGELDSPSLPEPRSPLEPISKTVNEHGGVVTAPWMGPQFWKSVLKDWRRLREDTRTTGALHFKDLQMLLDEKNAGSSAAGKTALGPRAQGARDSLRYERESNYGQAWAAYA